MCIRDRTNAQEAKTIKSASLQALLPHFSLRADRLYNAPDTEIDFTDQGGLMWGDQAVGKLIAGDDIMHPKVSAFVDSEAGTEVHFCSSLTIHESRYFWMHNIITSNQLSYCLVSPHQPTLICKVNFRIWSIIKSICS